MSHDTHLLEKVKLKEKGASVIKHVTHTHVRAGSNWRAKHMFNFLHPFFFFFYDENDHFSCDDAIMERKHRVK